MRYEQYSLLEDAKRVYHYIDGMTDRAYDYLPFVFDDGCVHFLDGIFEDKWPHDIQ